VNIFYLSSKAEFKVFSSICANLTAFWFLAIFVTKDITTIIANILLVMLSWFLAIKAEELSEK